jgi:hypothetical protein
MHVHAIGALDRVTLLETEENIQEQEVFMEEPATEEVELEYPRHEPATSVKGKPRSILSLLRFSVVNLEFLMLFNALSC